MSAKESELLQIFRELMACDIYVPDHYFDRQLQAERRAKKLKDESYEIPLNVFWRPVELPEHYEPQLNKFTKKVNDMPHLTKENYGQFLAKPLREELLKSRSSLAKLEQLRAGGTENALYEVHHVPKNEQVRFDKFLSHG